MIKAMVRFRIKRLSGLKFSLRLSGALIYFHGWDI